MKKEEESREAPGDGTMTLVTRFGTDCCTNQPIRAQDQKSLNDINRRRAKDQSEVGVKNKSRPPRKVSEEHSPTSTSHKKSSYHLWAFRPEKVSWELKYGRAGSTDNYLFHSEIYDRTTKNRHQNEQLCLKQPVSVISTWIGKSGEKDTGTFNFLSSEIYTLAPKIRSEFSYSHSLEFL